MQEDKKLQWADNLRAIATIAVIVLHVTAGLVYQYRRVPENHWWIGHVCNSAVRFCVPIFLMLTGALMLPKTYELIPYIKKRFTRILIPFVFWSLIYVFFNGWLIGKSWTFDWHLVTYVATRLRDGAMFHLWYIYTILGIYLFLPMMSKWIVASSAQETAFYIAVWFVVLVFRMPALQGWMPVVDWMYFSGYLGFLVLGYWLSKLAIAKPSQLQSLGVLLFVLGVAFTIGATFYRTQQQHKLSQLFYAYTSPNVVLASVGLFLMVRFSQWQIRFGQSLIKLLSRYSYGIYLSHALVLILLSKAGVLWSLINPWIGIPLTTLLCLALSLGLTYILHKIPWGAWIAG